MRALSRGASPALLLRLATPFLLSLLSVPAHAAFVSFENCLPDSITNSEPRQLQFTPEFVGATFVNIPQGAHFLNLTVFGNVSGQQFEGTLPPGSDTEYWNNTQEVNGKIQDVGNANKYSTLTADYTVLTYSAFDNRGERFCPTVQDEECPLTPVFSGNASDPDTFHKFFLAHDFGSSYAFSTISATIHIISGDNGGADIACISAQITPDLGKKIAGLLTWLPAAILILKGLATLTAAIWSPWGSSDIFRWSSNYGRDEDLLRLVTPGFGDCLQYIQFVVLTGSLALQYPGFYQPAVSQSAWSVLMFNESFVSDGSGTQSLVDGLYNTNATYGLTKMSQLVGMSEGKDIWACMAIWLLVIAGVVVVLCQLGFAGRWVFHLATKTTEEDLRQKNLPFTLGNMIRLLFNFFILPIVALSLFQLVLSPRSPISVLVCAAILLAIMIVWAGWILHVIFRTKPRTMLFDDMPTVLLYGPLYNTYNDSAAPFALVPVAITFMRGVAIGAVQPSGIGQIIILAICEVILILSLNGFRPFQGQTSMNLYHTFFATTRLVIVVLMIAFVPSLGVTEAPKGWIGYVILILHACVLVFGFFLNSTQTLIEVLARTMGAGGDPHHGAVRGSILNWRMLKKRQDRQRDAVDRGSMSSHAAMLATASGARSDTYGRSRSVSASSAQLLNRLSGFENFSQGGEGVSSPDADTENANGFVSVGSAAGRTSVSKQHEGDAFYRPPRPRKATMETLANASRTRSTGDVPYTDSPSGPSGHTRDASYDSVGFHGSPAPAYMRDRQVSNEETNGPRTDYAVREVDQYYRGPALNDAATRKLKTGPADPVGPVVAAQGWFQKLLFGATGKKKDQTKGFEVVRSSRMPPHMQQDPASDDVELQSSPAMNQEPYRDAPDTLARDPPAMAGAERSIDGAEDVPRHSPQSSFHFGFESNTAGDNTRMRPDSDALGGPIFDPISGEHRTAMGVASAQRPDSRTSTVSRLTGRQSSQYPEEQGDAQRTRYSDQPIPSLAPIDAVGGIDLPSRFNSTASRYTEHKQSDATSVGAPGQTPDIGETAGAQDWLRAVDQLEWPDHSRPSTSGNSTHQATQVSVQSVRAAPPSVPRRSSRRTPSGDISKQSQPQERGMFEGFDQSSPNDEGQDNQLGNPNQQSISHHRAGDSITRNSIGSAAALREAEVSIEYGTPPQDGYLHNPSEE